MAKRKRKRTPEERAAWEQFTREADARLAKLRELVAKGEAELEAHQAEKRRASS